MSSLQISQIIFRKRDESGNLVHANDELPDGVKVDRNGMRVISGKRVSFKTMFKQVNKHLSPAELDQAWDDYREMQAAKSARMQADLEEYRAING